MVDHIEGNIINLMVDSKLEPDKDHLTQGPLLNTDSSKSPHLMDETSCSHQEPRYNQEDKSAIYNVDASTCSTFECTNYLNGDFTIYGAHVNIDLMFDRVLVPEGYQLVLQSVQGVVTGVSNDPEEIPCEFDVDLYSEVDGNVDVVLQDSEKFTIDKLNEIMLRKKQVVFYEMVSAQSPGFKFIATNYEIYAYGEGMSKIKAKINAVIDFLDKLDTNNENIILTSTTNKISKVNFIGMLQNLCVARHWKFPDYKFPYDKNNKTHDTWYSVLCNLYNITSIGKGKTKKDAKRKAAQIMFDKVRYFTRHSISNAKDYSISSTFIGGVQFIKENNDFNYLNDLQSFKMFFNRLKLSQNQSLSKLRNIVITIDKGENAIELLKEIGKEEHFIITFILMTIKLNDIEICAQLDITPPLKFIGTGKSMSEAQEMAAYVALSYIKLSLEE